MNFIYSNLLPLDGYSADQIITERFRYEFQNSEKVEIAVGYVSEASLTELGNLVSLCNTKNIVLVIGMHYIEGISERTYRKAMELNKQWCATGIGEIRIVRAFKFHGKLYAFYRNGIPISAMIGSANLSAIKLEASNRRQYEIMGITTDLRECTEISTFIMRLKTDPCSINIDDAANMPIIRESNTSLTGIDTVFRIPMAEVEIYEGHKTATSFMLPIKVPAYNDRFMDDNKHYTKSNLNVCYAAPRNARKPRDWYETQFTVSKDIVLLEGYPKKNQPFYVVTDDGYTFKAHTTSDHNKQFSAVGDELILGRWIKGRLAAAGLVTPVNDTKADVQRHGMITKEMLDAYGCDTLILTKTSQQKEDENGDILDVWYLSFQAGTQLLND